MSEVVRFVIGGMSCASCAQRVERVIAGVEGVESVCVNFALSTATVQLGAGVGENPIIQALAAAGYEARREKPASAEAVEAAEAEAARERKDYGRAALLAGVLAAPVFVLDMGAHLLPAFHHWREQTFSPHLLPWLFLFLASLVQFGPGWRFYRAGVPALWRRVPDMNSLVVLGTTAAWLYSALAVVSPGWWPAGEVHLYFEASVVIITLVLLGRWLEAVARGRASEAIRRLAALRPALARVEHGGTSLEVPVAEVVAGDHIRLRPGEKVPVDGIVLQGETYIDQSMISGEPLPVLRRPGDAVVGGTLNTTGNILYRATTLGADSVLSRIMEIVRASQNDKLPVQALVDRVTAVFVPAVLLVAILTFALWSVLGPSFSLAVVNAVAVLIIACPCAMGLATPVSILAGTGQGAQLGILFRRGQALQLLAECQIVAFDKTGTLTQGQPGVTDIRVLSGMTEEEALALAAAVENYSEHPLARAILQVAKERAVCPAGGVTGFSAERGLGVRAVCEGQTLRIGSARFLQQEGIALAPAALDDIPGDASVLHLAIGSHHAASFFVRDPLRPTTREAVESLRRAGLRLVMMTGDSTAPARAVAAELGLTEVIAELLPGEKLEAIRRLQKGGRVVFVGDGINDAPALAAADVGVAIGSATDVAIESAEVVLVNGDLRKTVTALHLSRATLRNIRQNLFWAFGYNALLIPVAAGVLYPAAGILLSPMLAAAAMALSSLCVVGNALRLTRFRA